MIGSIVFRQSLPQAFGLYRDGLRTDSFVVIFCVLYSDINEFRLMLNVHFVVVPQPRLRLEAGHLERRT